MRSQTLKIFKRWLELATEEQKKFVDDVYFVCEKNYSAGGDEICECWTPSEICEEFSTLDEVRTYCGLKIERSLNCRWGEDSDPELETAENFKNASWDE